MIDDVDNLFAGVDLAEDFLADGALGDAAVLKFRPALRYWRTERLEMGVVGERVQAGVDGEPMTLEAPLRFWVEPGALRVLLPEGLPANRRVPPLEAGRQAAETLHRWLHPTLAVVQNNSGSGGRSGEA